jgi:predicted flap endonuclease-1-like 5' DNA nuclease
MMLKLRYLLIGLILGLLIAWLWFEEDTRQLSSPAVSPLPPSPPATNRKQKDAAQKDSLIEIDGIGPAYERALNALGIFTFAQLAAQNADSLAASLSARVTAERISREKWIEQAKKRAN